MTSSTVTSAPTTGRKVGRARSVRGSTTDARRYETRSYFRRDFEVEQGLRKLVAGFGSSSGENDTRSYYLRDFEASQRVAKLAVDGGPVGG